MKEFEWVADIKPAYVIPTEFKITITNVTDIDAVERKFHELWGKSYIKKHYLIGIGYNHYINIFNNNEYLKSCDEVVIYVNRKWCPEHKMFLIKTSWDYDVDVDKCDEIMSMYEFLNSITHEQYD